MDEKVMADCERLYSLMRRFWLGLNQQVTSALLRGKLNMPQHSALVVLQGTGETTMGNLAKRLGVTMGASTNIVDKLVYAGYVDRRRSDTDRRVVNVKLRIKGEKVLAESAEGFRNYAANILSRIPAPERQVFLETYMKIVEISESEEPGTDAETAHETGPGSPA